MKSVQQSDYTASTGKAQKKRFNKSKKNLPTFPKCECGNRAIGRFTPDLDIYGIPFCGKCKEKVWLKVWLMLNDNP